MISHSSWFDALFILRSLRRSKTLATLIVATIALVICGVTLIASIVVASLVDRGPYHRPDRVVGLQLTAPSLLYPRIYFANEDYIALRNSTVADDGIFDALLPLGIAYVMMTGGGVAAHYESHCPPRPRHRHSHATHEQRCRVVW